MPTFRSDAHNFFILLPNLNYGISESEYVDVNDLDKDVTEMSQISPQMSQRAPKMSQIRSQMWLYRLLPNRFFTP